MVPLPSGGRLVGMALHLQTEQSGPASEERRGGAAKAVFWMSALISTAATVHFIIGQPRNETKQESSKQICLCLRVLLNEIKSRRDKEANAALEFCISFLYIQ